MRACWRRCSWSGTTSSPTARRFVVAGRRPGIMEPPIAAHSGRARPSGSISVCRSSSSNPFITRADWGFTAFSCAIWFAYSPGPGGFQAASARRLNDGNTDAFADRSLQEDFDSALRRILEGRSSTSTTSETAVDPEDLDPSSSPTTRQPRRLSAGSPHTRCSPRSEMPAISKSVNPQTFRGLRQRCFARQVAPESVAALELHDAEELFPVVERNRAYLREWLPWWTSRNPRRHPGTSTACTPAEADQPQAKTIVIEGRSRVAPAAIDRLAE